MTTYAIGDIASNYDLLLRLLDKIGFNPQQDSLWFTGNLINPEKAEPLSAIRFIKGLGRAAVTVLGDADLRFLSIIEGYAQAETHEGISELGKASDFQELAKWLRNQPLLHYDAKLNFAIVHAGIPPEWSLSQARTFAIEVESALSFGNHKAFLENINGKPPPRRWNAKLRGWKRLHFITNAFTRLQQCNTKGYMDFGIKVSAATPADEYMPWYHLPNRNMANINIIFSQQTARESQPRSNIFPISSDTTQVGSLTALKLTPVPETITVC